MQNCGVEGWTIENLVLAMKDEHPDGIRIDVPKFQRGGSWNSEQEKGLIDSLEKGFPVGSMLFYKKIEDNIERYVLVDGLQRGTTIRKFKDNPADFMDNKDIPDDFCESVLRLVNVSDTEQYDWLRSILIDFIKQHIGEKNMQFYNLSCDIFNHFQFQNDRNSQEALIGLIQNFYNDWDVLYKQILEAKIPVITYQGAWENLPTIFSNINSKGTFLSDYEIYAASWPTEDAFSISNETIIAYIMKKYDYFFDAGFKIDDYDPEEMRKSKKVTAFEYLFGLSKFLIEKYEDILTFGKKAKDDEIATLGFELLDACFNEEKMMATLYEHIYNIKDKEKFERALYNAIDFVKKAIKPVIEFKGNTHKATSKNIFHSKNQILSMIATTFRKMYTQGNYASLSKQWSSMKAKWSKNLLYYYAYDIITGYWGDAVAEKMYNAVKTNRYESEISPAAWQIALDNYYGESMLAKETSRSRIPGPKNADYVILNCTYLKIFDTLDQLSEEIQFDVEHIAPKKQMKSLIAKTEGDGLPISSIANLCYLPDKANRSKKDNNFYQDTKYLKNIDLKEVESKYSFTTEEDLKWMDKEYQGADDFDALKQAYVTFCKNRFEKVKIAFFEAMDIDYTAMNEIV